MKHHLITLATFFAFAPVVFSQTAEIEQANAMYAAGNYGDAAEAYEAVIDSFGSAPQIYLNLANACYKANETARAILNYERALKLNPRYEAAKTNLQLAQQRVIDNIAQTPPFFLKRWTRDFVQLLGSDEWFAVSIVSFALCMAAILAFIFGFSKLFRKSTFYIAVVLLIISLSTVCFSVYQKNALLNHNSAIVMEGTVTVKSAPDRSGTDLFQLHEGTKVIVRDTVGDWVEILAGNSNVGWVEDRTVERI